MKHTMPVPSLSKDSPSTKVENRLLVPSSCNKATTATGSVALMRAPNMRANGHVHEAYSGTNRLMPIMRAAVSSIQTTNPGTASRVELANVFLKMCMFISYAASNIKMGRKTYRMKSGFVSATVATAFSTRGMKSK